MTLSSDLTSRYRPRARWWVVGALMFPLAGIAFAIGLYVALAPMSRVDAVVPGDGTAERVDVPAGEERALFTRQGYSVECEITDADGGTAELRSVGGDDFEYDYQGWTAVGAFDTGAGDVTLACTSNDGSDVRVAQIPSTAAYAAGFALAIGGGIGFALLGLGVLTTTGILYAVRPARPR